MDKTHKAIAKGLGHTDVSPAALAYKMLQESRYVNESLLQYLVNYVVIMATHPVMPLHLKPVQDECKTIYTSVSYTHLTLPTNREV